MTDVACFCGCLYSFDGGAAACPRCGKHAAVPTGAAFTRAEAGQPGEQRVLAACQDGQTAASSSLCELVLASALLDDVSAADALARDPRATPAGRKNGR
jgi:hypothetical protein